MKDFDIPAHIQIAEFDAAVMAQSLAEINNAIKRHQERMEHFLAWVDPKAVAARKLRLEEEADAALKAAGPPRKSLPVPEPLPPEMVGQPLSTIQAMLRNGWRPE